MNPRCISIFKRANKVAFFCLSATLIFSCGNDASTEKTEKKSVLIANEDSATEETDSKSPILDPEMTLYFENEIRDLHKFDINYHFPEFEEKFRKLKSDPDTEIIPEKEEVCRGDACQTLKTFRLNNELIKISKFDGSEYGFSNYEYYFKDSILVFYREFRLSPELSEDEKHTIWEIKDLQYIFSGDAVTLRKKIKLTEDLKYDYSLKNEKAKISKLKRSEVEIVTPELHKEL